MKPSDFNAWAKRFIWPFNLPKSCPVNEMDPAGPACEEWVRTFQKKYGLVEDGRLGPSTLHACVAVYGDLGGVQHSLIINGKEIPVDFPVARFFKPAEGETIRPDLITLLSIGELERMARQRREGKKPHRAHFSIDAAEGRQGRSLIIQWADPARPVDFTPAEETGDYPAQRVSVGIEMENPLTFHNRDRDARRWLRRRSTATAKLNGRRAKQLAYFDEQIEALSALLDTLTQHLDIPRRIPLSGPHPDTRCAPEELSSWRGCLPKYNYIDKLGEPGAGFADAALRLFPLPKEIQAEPEPESNYISPLPQPEAPKMPSAELYASGDTEKEKASLKEVWESAPTTPVLPISHAEETQFSWGNALKKRGGRRRARGSRVEKIKARLAKRQAD